MHVVSAKYMADMQLVALHRLLVSGREVPTNTEHASDILERFLRDGWVLFTFSTRFCLWLDLALEKCLFRFH
jgi:hypothetical protein